MTEKPKDHASEQAQCRPLEDRAQCRPLDGQAITEAVPLLRGLLALSLDLSSAGVFSLPVGQLVTRLPGMGLGDSTARAAFGAGSRLGLVKSCSRQTRFAFPLSRVFFAAPGAVVKLVPSSYDVLLRRKTLQPVSQETVETLIRRGLAHFEEGAGGFLANATFLLEGLRDGIPKSAAEAAKVLGVSAGRLRRARTQFWDSFSEGRRMRRRTPLDKVGEGRRWLIAAFLAMLANRSGRLVVNPASDSARDACSLGFLAKCAGVNLQEVPELGISVLGNRALAGGLLDPPAGPGPAPVDSLDPVRIAEALEETEEGFTPEDVACLAARIRVCRAGQLTPGEKVATSLRAIGKPGHYSEIALAYSSLFPEDGSDERTVYAALLNESAKGPEGLVVWAGARGVFALREWGFERPSSSLFVQAEEIVRRKHAETARPVPLAVIASELGTKRAAVNRASLVSVLRGNPALTSLGGGFFLPASEDRVPAQERLLISGDALPAHVPVDHAESTGHDEPADPGEPADPADYVGPAESVSDQPAVYFDDALDEALRAFERDKRAPK